MGTCTSRCLHQFKDLKSSDTSCAMNDSNKKSAFATATPASEVDHATTPRSSFSEVEKQIERSKAHWSTLTDHSSDMDEEEVDFEGSNEQEFKALQRHFTYGGFFSNFTGDGISTGYHHGELGELVVGKKFAEGGQAELYETQIKWNDPRNVEQDQNDEREYVLKVFKEGTLLKHVKSQLPQGLLLDHLEAIENRDSPTPKTLPVYNSRVHAGILLKNGRFAFLMQKRQCDLRTLIERNMKLRIGEEDCGPFSKEEGEFIMYNVALGVNSLHNRDIVHRDLKASNVLVHETKRDLQQWYCFVADYECSIGVVGTNFFRAPEILQACKDGKVREMPEVFSRAADVYSYGMTCYEILTGKLPFEDHPLRGRPSLLVDLVINQHLRPELPICIEDWARELLSACWQVNPTRRPQLQNILNVLSTNSTRVRIMEVVLKKRYGENFRI